MDALSLVAYLTLDSKDYDKGLEDAGKSASSFGSKLKSGLKTAGKVGAAAVTAVTVATTALSTALVKGVGGVAEYGDNIDKMSQKMGMSAEAYQEWDAIMRHSGTSIESMQAGMKTLANAVENGNKAFERLGMSQEDIANMSQEDLFSATITALQNVENETERTYLAGQLLGRGATELGALLNTSAEDTEKMRKRVHELGGVMSDEAVKASAAYQDSLQDMQTAFSGLSRNLMSEFLPSVTTVMDGLTEIFAGDSETGIAMISSGIDGLVEDITEKIPQFADVALGIIEAIATAIIENLPKITETAVEIVFSLINYIIENLPQFVDVALQMIMTLADALIANIPTLIPAVVDVLLAIVEKLTEPDTLMQLVEAGIKLIIALIEGLIKAIPQIVAAIPRIISNIVQALIQGVPQIFKAGGELLAGLGRGLMSGISSVGQWVGGIVGKIKDGLFGAVSGAWTWGKDLIGNFVSGIKEKADKVKDAVKGVAGKIKSFLGFSEPEEGPLSNFHTYAPDMMKLFAEGVKKNTNVVTDQIEKSFDFGNIGEFSTGSSGFATTNMGGITINVQAAPGMDTEELADLIMERMQDAVNRKAAAVS